MVEARGEKRKSLISCALCKNLTGHDSATFEHKVLPVKSSETYKSNRAVLASCVVTGHSEKRAVALFRRYFGVILTNYSPPGIGGHLDAG